MLTNNNSSLKSINRYYNRSLIPARLQKCIEGLSGPLVRVHDPVPPFAAKPKNENNADQETDQWNSERRQQAEKEDASYGGEAVASRKQKAHKTTGGDTRRSTR